MDDPEGFERDLDVGLVGVLAAETRFVVQEFMPGAATSILTAGVCCDVLEHYGVAAEPTPAIVIAGNDAWVEWQAAGRWTRSDPERPPDAFSHGVNPYERSTPERPNVHLVVAAAGGLLDADMGYWNRPDRGILFPQGGFLVNGFGSYQFKRGCGMLIYRQPRHDDGAWRESKQWLAPRGWLVKRMIGVCERMMVV